MSDARQWRKGADVAGIRAFYKPKDDQVVVNEATGDIYRFDASSGAADDGDATLKPDNIHASLPGRWLKANPPDNILSALAEIAFSEDFPVFAYDATLNKVWGDSLWEEALGGTGAHDVLSNVSGHVGVYRPQVSAVTDYAGLDRGFFKLGEGTLMEMEMLVYFPAGNVPDASDDFIAFIGAGNNKSLSNFDSGMYGIGFYARYADDNSVRFIAYTSDGATPTKEITDVAVVADAWYKLKVVYNGTDVKFYVNDVLKKTITTTIPLANNIQPQIANRKSVGTNARRYGCDFFGFKFRPTR